MALFLNAEKLNEWIPKIINETIRELVIIVPYIKTSDRVYQPLKGANARGVETTLVYREDKLSLTEKAKFAALDNLNLLHHPNVHCKCYYNEKYLLITSMNMYEYSEKNNREMGILIHREALNKDTIRGGDDQQIFEDAIREIRLIINGAHLEKESRETVAEGFEMDIIKSSKEKALEKCQVLNKAFVHKRFDVVERGDGWHCVCSNYFDKIEVVLSHRAELTLMMEDDRKSEIFNRFRPVCSEFLVAGFKLYWNHFKSSIYLYANSKHAMWYNDLSDLEEYRNYRKGIDEVVSYVRKYI